MVIYHTFPAVNSISCNEAHLHYVLLYDLNVHKQTVQQGYICQVSQSTKGLKQLIKTYAM